MQYGFVTDNEYLHQTHGFFVDSDNQILYWPHKKSTGFEISFETAVQISHEKERGLKSGVLDLPLFFGALFGSMYLDKYDLGFSVNSFFVAIFAFGLYRLFIYLRARNRIADLLRSCQTVDRERPQIQYVSADAVDTQTSKLAIIIIILIMTSFFIFMIVVAITTPGWESKLTALSLGALMCLPLVVYLKRRSSRVVSLEALWFYEPTEEEIEKYNISILRSSQ